MTACAPNIGSRCSLRVEHQAVPVLSRLLDRRSTSNNTKTTCHFILHFSRKYIQFTLHASPLACLSVREEHKGTIAKHTIANSM